MTDTVTRTQVVDAEGNAAVVLTTTPKQPGREGVQGSYVLGRPTFRLETGERLDVDAEGDWLEPVSGRTFRRV